MELTLCVKNQANIKKVSNICLKKQSSQIESVSAFLQQMCSTKDVSVSSINLQGFTKLGQSDTH